DETHGVLSLEKCARTSHYMPKTTGERWRRDERRDGPSAHLGAADIDLAGDDGPFDHLEARSGHVPFDRSRRAKLDSFVRLDVALHGAADHDAPGDEVGGDFGRRSDRQAVISELDSALHVAFDREIFIADDLAFDPDRPSDPRDEPALVSVSAGLG